MAKRTYGEEERTTVEKTIHDRKVIQGFMDELRAVDNSEQLLEASNNSQIQASIEYQLIHPYEGENFAYALLHNEEVAAQVDLYVNYDGEEEKYSGKIQSLAADIFHPRELLGLEIEGSSSEETVEVKAGTD